MRLFVVLTVAAAALLACSAQKRSEVPMPSVPAELREPQLRANYIIEHFWDNADSLSAYSRTALEQAFSNFISVFPIADEAAREAAVKNLMNKAQESHDEYARMAEIADVYLYSIDSPVASDDYYILFLKEIVGSPVLDDTEKIRPQFQLENLLKNRPGMVAADFPFETLDARQTSVHAEAASLADGQEMLFILYDPDCGHCRKVMDELVKDPDVVNGAMKVVAVYSGEERELWQKTAAKLPSSWVVGYEDGTMQDEGAYAIRTLPTLYRIDKNAVIQSEEKHN